MEMTDPFAAITEFEPRKKPVQSSATGEARTVAEQHGFTITNFSETRRSFRKITRAPKPPTVAQTMRIHLSDWNRFQAYCEQSGITVAMGFSALVEQLPPPLDEEG